MRDEVGGESDRVAAHYFQETQSQTRTMNLNRRIFVSPNARDTTFVCGNLREFQGVESGSLGFPDQIKDSITRMQNPWSEKGKS